MGQTQSIIVYRNPIEAAFWEGGYALPVFCFILAFLVVMLPLIKVQDFVFRRAKWRMWGPAYSYSGYAVIAFSLVAAFFITAKVLA